jgi:hypothetical protein
VAAAGQACLPGSKPTTVFTTLGQISREGSFPLPEAGFPSSGVEIGLQA